MINDINYSNINFKAGLTLKMKKEISNCNPNKISYYLKQNSIASDFKKNKAAAWCTLQCFEMIKTFNKIFNLNLGYPKGIIVEDFNNLKTGQIDAYAFTNLVPVKLYLDNNFIVPERVIFLNKIDWNKIDEISDENYECGTTTTNFFLETILHEFCHVIHESNLLKLMSGDDVVMFLKKVLSAPFVESFYDKYANVLKSICSYAAANPFEAVACDLSNRVINNIDKSTLVPKKDFIKSSPYINTSVINKTIKSTNKKEKNILLHNIWTGNL